MIELVEVWLWGRRIGALAQREHDAVASFEYDPAFLASGIEVSPIHMPLRRGVFRFPALGTDAFHGLPGLVADVLPDRFGNAVINTWLARQGRPPESFGALDRLCYIGERGVGALTFRPAIGPQQPGDAPVEIAALVGLANEVLAERDGFATSMPDDDPHRGLLDILAVGTSAGGARAKALIAWNPDTCEVRSGQLDVGPGFEHWLVKFDGVSGNRDRELADPMGFGVVEMAYHELAVAAGIDMAECRLLQDGDRRHFMTRRFDRDAQGGRLHMQSLAGLAHFDFNEPGAHGYEQVFAIMRRLGMGGLSLEQQFRRMVFNIVARNQDDHVKNIAFLMDKAGRWRLSPAYDLTWSYNPFGRWTSRHQMTVNGKNDGFELADLESVARVASLKRGRARAILDEVTAAVRTWPQVASELGMVPPPIQAIATTHRLSW